MADLPEAVTRVLGFYDATAADLMTAGGILRCGECGGERPLGDVAGYLGHGWPEHCGKTMTWVTLKQLAAEARTVPDGYELVAVPDEAWQVDSTRRCRRQLKGHRACGLPSVAALNRPMRLRGRTQVPERTVGSLWGYCLSHLYGRWIEEGHVMHWVLREAAGDG